MKPYTTEIEQIMHQFYMTLSEKDKRRYAAIEATKLERGGVTYIAGILGCDRKTIQAGMKELGHLAEEPEMAGRIRKSGGGRKSYYETFPDIDKQFLTVLRDYTAGDPMRDDVRWTNLTPREIANHLETEYQVKVSTKIIGKLLKKHNYRRRKAQKNKQ